MKRDTTVDVIKGLAIILMVAMHAQLRGLRFVNMFHMPVFFMAAGYFFNREKVLAFSDWTHYAVGKIRRLWLPYAFWHTLFVLLTNAFIACGIYAATRRMTSPQILREIVPFPWPGGQSLIGGFWFIKALFAILLTYSLLEWLLGKLKVNSFCVQSVISLVFVLAGRSLGDGAFGKWVGYHFFACYALFHVGLALRKVKRAPGFLISLAVLAGLYRFELVSLNINLYRNGLTLVAGAVAGWYLLGSVARFLSRRGWSVAERTLAYLGRHTLPILIFHLYCFKLVDALALALTRGDFARLPTFPVVFVGVLWWIPYTLVGVVIPLGANALWWGFYERFVSHAKGIGRSA